MATKVDGKGPAVTGIKDPLQFPNINVGRSAERREHLEAQTAFFKRNSGYKDYNAHSDKIHCISWNADGSLLATGSYDKSVILFAYKDGKLFREYSLKEHNHSIDQLAWHPTKPEILLTYCADRVVRLWNVRQRKALQSYSIKADAICVAWAPDGKTFAIGDKEDILTFYEVERGQKVDRQFNYEINEFMFRESNNTTYLFLTTGTSAGHGGRLEYFQYKFPELQSVNSIPVSGVTSTVVKMDPKGEILAVGGVDGNVTLWDLNGMFPMQEISRQKQSVRCVTFSHDSRFLASSAEQENSVDVALVETGEKVWSFQNEERDDEESASLSCLAFHPTQLFLACAYDHKKSHKDASFIRLFGGSATHDDKKKDSGRDSRGRSREREKIKKASVKVEKDGNKEKDGKPTERVRFESKFSFLRPTAEQLAGLEERKAAKEARDAKAAAAAQARAAAAAARLPVKVATRLTASSTNQPIRSGIRETIKPQLPPSNTRDSPKNSRPASPRTRDAGNGRRDEDGKEVPPANSKEFSSRSTSTNSRRPELEENDRKRVRSSTRDADGKDSRQQPSSRGARR